MKPLLLSTVDSQGGAARAGYRLYEGLRRIGVDAQMLVQVKHSDDNSIFAPASKWERAIAQIKPYLDHIPLQLYPQRLKAVFSCEWLPDSVQPAISKLQPDVVNLHWICDGFLQIQTLSRIKQPLVWTLHDMWAFTGGCHYSQECKRYQTFCGACPQLQSPHEWDISHWTWQRKARAWKHLNLTVVTPSHWLAECAQSSALFHNYPVAVIPNGLDLARYRPFDRRMARDLLNLPQDKQLVLFGAINATRDLRKGFHLLLPALERLSQMATADQLELLVFGASGPHDLIPLDLKIRYLGRLNDDLSLALAYSAADVFVAPSMQENLSNTVLEAIACGTPCVAFKIGGMPDMIEHQVNGYLVQPFEPEDLARGIHWILADHDRHQILSTAARQKAEQEFDANLQAQRYLDLFNTVVSKANSKSTL
jgi:glycosyltransferase involved in cell wall biosynthesis